MSAGFTITSDYSEAAVWVIHRERHRFDFGHRTFRQAASPSPPHVGGNTTMIVQEFTLKILSRSTLVRVEAKLPQPPTFD